MGVFESVVAAISTLSVVGKAFGWLKRLRGRKELGHDVPAGASIGGNIDSSVVAGRDMRVEGDLTILAHGTSAPEAWWAAEGAPRFRLSPNRNLSPFQLRMSFDVTTDFQLNPTARWRGAGVDMDLVEPMPQNRPNSYQMKAIPADPEMASDPDVPPSFVGSPTSARASMKIAWKSATNAVIASASSGAGYSSSNTPAKRPDNEPICAEALAGLGKSDAARAFWESRAQSAP